MRESNYNFPRRQSRPIVYGGGGSTTTTSGCACTCIDDGDIEVNGIITTSQWRVIMPTTEFRGTYGTIVFPGGTYVIIYDSGSETWVLDIGDYLTAEYNDHTDATADTTMDGEITMTWDGSEAEVKLCVDGDVPEPA